MQFSAVPVLASPGRRRFTAVGEGRVHLRDDLVEPAELFFQFGELVLEVEEDAVVEVGEFAVEGFDWGGGGGEFEGEEFVACYGAVAEVWGVGCGWRGGDVAVHGWRGKGWWGGPLVVL